MKHLKVFVILLAVTGIAGCSQVQSFGSSVSSKVSSIGKSDSKAAKSKNSKKKASKKKGKKKESLVSRAKKAQKKTTKTIKKQAAVVTGGLVGEDEYKKAVAKARRNYKKIPSAQICWQARQEIAQSWELYKANKRFIRKNSIGNSGKKLWSAFTSNLYKTVDNAIPLPLPDLPEDQISYAAKQVTYNRDNIKEWASVYNSLCKK